MGSSNKVIINLRNLIEGIREDIRRQLMQCDDAALASVLDQIGHYSEYGEREELIVNKCLRSVLSLAFVYEARQEMRRRLDSIAVSESKAKANTVGNDTLVGKESGAGRGGSNL